MLTQQEKQVSIILLNYQRTGKSEIQTLGNVEVYQHRFKDVKLLKKLVDLGSYTPDELKLFADACSLANPGILQLFSQRKLNPNAHELFLEDVACTLAEEIEMRKKTSTPFRDIEVLAIATSVLNALSAFQENCLPHRQITPFSILKTAQGEYKIMHPLALGSRLPTYNKILNEGLVRLYRYIPPEAKYHVAKGTETPASDPFKEDVYSLGITLIEACALDTSDSDYKVKLKEVKNIYSFPLVNLLEKMIDNNHLIRPPPSAVLEWIRVHNLQEKITGWLTIRSSDFPESPVNISSLERTIIYFSSC